MTQPTQTEQSSVAAFVVWQETPSFYYACMLAIERLNLAGIHPPFLPSFESLNSAQRDRIASVFDQAIREVQLAVMPPWQPEPPKETASAADDLLRAAVDYLERTAPSPHFSVDARGYLASAVRAAGADVDIDRYCIEVSAKHDRIWVNTPEPRCFWCDQPVGKYHLSTCDVVMRRWLDVQRARKDEDRD